MMINFTVIVGRADLDTPRDALIGSIVERFRAGLVREVNNMERRRHEASKRPETRSVPTRSIGGLFEPSGES